MLACGANIGRSAFERLQKEEAVNTEQMFDFGIKVARPIDRVRYRIPGAMWSWSIIFHDQPGVIYHIVRRTGNLKRWN